jgi:integrase
VLRRKVRSKTEADTEADLLRAAIRDGTFPHVAAAPAVQHPDQLTLAFGDIFMKQCPKRKGKHRGDPRDANDRSRLNRLNLLPGTRGPLGQMPISMIVEADLEAALRALRTAGAAASTHNHYLQFCQSLSKWGQKKGYLTRSWFAVDSDVRREDLRSAQRHRRLVPDTFNDQGHILIAGEEHRLVEVAPPRLQQLIMAALETCCREGELIHLQWRHVSADAAWLQIPARLTKDGDWREIPISSRLRAVLDMARLDPAGRRHAEDAYIFGNEFGEFIPFPKKAWETTVLKAHGHEPQWEKGEGKLTAGSRGQLEAIDLHFHDLRHEAGSRLLEAGWPLHHVRDMLGHADISTTCRYLNAERHGLRASMQRSDEARTRVRMPEKFAQTFAQTRC